MGIRPCLWCGGEAHIGGHSTCGFRLTSKPTKWDNEIDALAHSPVSNFIGIGQMRRLRMLKHWSGLPKRGKISQVPSDPKEFHNIPVESMSEGVLFAWCAILNISVRDVKTARHKLKNTFTRYAQGTLDVHTTTLPINHPYRCSEHPDDTRTAMGHTRSISVDENNIFALFGTPCPEEGCGGLLEPVYKV